MEDESNKENTARNGASSNQAGASSKPQDGASSKPKPYWSQRVKQHSADYSQLMQNLPIVGVRPHCWLDVGPMPLSSSLTRGNRTMFGGLHFPRETPHDAYSSERGDATDMTCRMLARAFQSALPPGVVGQWLMMFDYFDDLDGPRPLKVGSVDWSFRKHLWKRLPEISENQQFLWWFRKVRKLASVMVDEIVERGREGMDCFVAGQEALEFWPTLLADAAAIAVKEASDILGRPVAYDIAFPPDLPPLEPLSEGAEPPTCGKYEIQHPSLAAPMRFMSLCHRKRLDSGLAWVLRHVLNGAPIDYFQSMSSLYGGYREAEVKVLRFDAKALDGGYFGPWPLELASVGKKLSVEQESARDAAMRRSQSYRSQGGKKDVLAAKAGNETAQKKLDKIKKQKKANGKANGKATGKANIAKIPRATLQANGKANGKASGKKMSATKLAGGSKNAYKLNASRDSSARAKARWPEIKANFTLAKLNADSAIGGGKKAKGTRYYDQRDLINLAVDKGGDSCMAPIQDLQQRVLDLYK